MVPTGLLRTMVLMERRAGPLGRRTVEEMVLVRERLRVLVQLVRGVVGKKLSRPTRNNCLRKEFVLRAK